MSELSTTLFQTARVPRGTTEEPKPETAPRLRHRNLTLAVSIFSISLLVLGSGGILVELFLTGIVYDQGHADYVKAADKASGEGIALLHASAARGIGEREGQVAEATNQRKQILTSARSDADQERTEMLMTAQPRDLQELLLKYQLGNGRISMMWRFREIFIATQEALRTERKDPGLSLKVGFNVFDGDGIPRRRIFSVPWTDEQSMEVITFSCMVLPGVNESECVDEVDDRLRGPEQVAIARQREPIAAAVELNSGELIALQRYGVAITDLERIVFYNALDLERFRGGNPGVSGELLSAVNSELSRLRLGLATVRHRLQRVREVQSILRNPDGLLRASLTGEISPFLAKDLRRHEHSTDLIRAWVSQETPRFTAAALNDRERELATRATPFYRSVRPLLANVWEAFESGSVGTGGWFSYSAPQSPIAVVPGIFEQRSSGQGSLNGWSPWAVVGLALAVLGSLLWVLKKRLAAPVTWLRASVVLAPFCLLALLFPVRAAYNANSATKNRVESLAADIISHAVEGDYTSRAAWLQAVLEREAKELASGIRSQAEAEGKVLVNVAIQRKEVRLASLAVTSTKELSMVNLAEQIRYWIDRAWPSIYIDTRRCLKTGITKVENEYRIPSTVTR